MRHVLHGRNRSPALLIMALLLAAAAPASVSGFQPIGVEAQATAVVEVEEGDNPCMKAAWANYNSCLVNLTRKWLCDLAFTIDVVDCVAQDRPKAQ